MLYGALPETQIGLHGLKEPLEYFHRIADGFCQSNVLRLVRFSVLGVLADLPLLASRQPRRFLSSSCLAGIDAFDKGRIFVVVIGKDGLKLLKTPLDVFGVC